MKLHKLLFLKSAKNIQIRNIVFADVVYHAKDNSRRETFLSLLKFQVSASPLVLAAWKPPAEGADAASSAKPGDVEVKAEMTNEDATLTMNLAFYTQTVVEGN